MKKTASKSLRAKGSHRRTRDRPVEFDRGWHELEARHDRIKMDWSSLAAQLNIGGEDQPPAFD